ncbi:MAG: hypothetical protein KBA86_08875 [Bacteroidales bacterium]|nr:hypothetical protein [Bacteroidales bacterium]
MNFRRIVFFLSILYFTNHVSAQDSIMIKNQLKLEIGINLNQKVHIYDQPAEDYLSPIPSVGGNFSVYYYRYLGKGFGIQAGIGFTYHPHAFRITNDTLKQYLPAVYYSGNNEDFYFQIPVSVNYLVKINPRLFFDINAGYMASLGPSYSYTGHVQGHFEQNDTLWSLLQIGCGTSYAYNSNLFLKLGIQRTTKYFHTYGFHLVLNGAIMHKNVGEFEFSNLEKIKLNDHNPSGKFYKYFNYIGLNFNYGFRLDKKNQLVPW